MKLCYRCYLRLEEGNREIRSKAWDKMLCDTTTREKCEKCGLNGLMVREVDATE